MKKRLLALLLCVSMLAVTLVGCGRKEEPVVEPDPVVVEDTTPVVFPEPDTMASIDSNLPAPAYHFTFEDNNEGIVAVVRTETGPHNLPNGIAEDHGIPLLFTDGPVGKALYLDGTHGVRLPINALNTNTYSISFWVNADRLSQFGPALQIGNIAGDESADEVVTWLNFTQVDFTGERVFPTIWNRHSGNGQWPWLNVLGIEESIHGRREWAMFTLVARGDTYIFGETGEPRIATDLYINGVRVFYAEEGHFEYHGLAPDLMNDYGNFDALFGLNYWDELFKGYVDDFYIFTDALTAGQVAYLYSLGDPTVETAVPEIEDDPVAQVITNFDPNALYTLGDPDTEVMGFWSQHSNAYALADGGTLSIKFNNYGRGFNNWDGYVFVVTGTPYDKDSGHPIHETEGFLEYGVIRGDAFHWGDGLLEVGYEFSWDWDDFRDIMKNAQVTLNFSRSGSDFTMNGLVVDLVTGNEYTYVVTAKTAAGAGDPLFIALTGEKMFVEILSVD